MKITFHSNGYTLLRCVLPESIASTWGDVWKQFDESRYKTQWSADDKIGTFLKIVTRVYFLLSGQLNKAFA